MGGDRDDQVKIQSRLKQSIGASFPSHHVRPNGSSFGFPSAKGLLATSPQGWGLCRARGSATILSSSTTSTVQPDLGQRSSQRSVLPMPSSQAPARNDLLTSFHPASPSSLLKAFVSQILQLLPSSPNLYAVFSHLESHFSSLLPPDFYSIFQYYLR